MKTLTREVLTQMARDIGHDLVTVAPYLLVAVSAVVLLLTW